MAAKKRRKVVPIWSRPNFDSIHAPLFDRVPPPPRWLSDRARAIWRVAAKDLHDRGLLSKLYTSMLAMYCSVSARFEALPTEKPPALKMSETKWQAFRRSEWRAVRALARAMMLPLPIAPKQSGDEVSARGRKVKGG